MTAEILRSRWGNSHLTPRDVTRNPQAQRGHLPGSGPIDPLREAGSGRQSLQLNHGWKVVSPVHVPMGLEEDLVTILDQEHRLVDTPARGSLGHETEQNGDVVRMHLDAPVGDCPVHLAGAFVPWIPIPPMLRPSQWRPRGLPGPGGTLAGSRSPRARASIAMDSGTSHVGSVSRPRMVKGDSGVFHPTLPTATGALNSRSPALKKSIRCGMFTMIIPSATDDGTMCRLSTISSRPIWRGTCRLMSLSAARVDGSTPSRAPIDPKRFASAHDMTSDSPDHNE